MRDKTRIAVVGYGVIGKRVAQAVASQSDMVLAGVADVVADWRIEAAAATGLPLYAADASAIAPMRTAGLDPRGSLDDLLALCDARLAEHETYIRDHLADMPDISAWTWGGLDR